MCFKGWVTSWYCLLWRELKLIPNITKYLVCSIAGFNENSDGPANHGSHLDGDQHLLRDQQEQHHHKDHHHLWHIVSGWFLVHWMSVPFGQVLPGDLLPPGERHSLSAFWWQQIAASYCSFSFVYLFPGWAIMDHTTRCRLSECSTASTGSSRSVASLLTGFSSLAFLKMLRRAYFRNSKWGHHKKYMFNL